MNEAIYFNGIFKKRKRDINFANQSYLCRITSKIRPIDNLRKPYFNVFRGPLVLSEISVKDSELLDSGLFILDNLIFGKLNGADNKLG